MDTEAQQITIDLIIERIRYAIFALADKRNELVTQGDTQQVKDSLEIMAIRLDLLIKVERFLLEPIKEQYAFIARGSEVIQPGDITAMLNDTDNIFIKKVLQGV